MVQGKAFLANPKCQYRVSQCKEHDYSANNKKNRDYNECPSLSHFMMNFNYEKNAGKKSFSCQITASISCIATART